MRKIFFSPIIIIAIYHSIIFAGPYPCDYCNFLTNRGYYLGINGEWNTGPWKVKYPTSINTSFGTHGIKGGMMAGYSGVLNPYMYLATEVFVNLGQTRTAIKPISDIDLLPLTRAKLTTPYDFGMSILPGYMFSPCVTLYGRAGFIRTKFEFDSYIDDSSRSKTNSVYGGQFGFGLLVGLTRQINVRLEYDYTSYRSLSAFGNIIMPQNNQVNLGLFYKFVC